MKYINSENLFDYAFLNLDTLHYPVRAVCVNFHGYTDATIFERSNDVARELGEAGILFVFPYYSVWAWMSQSSREFIEQVLDAAYDRLSLDETVPLIVSGGSMGGLTALNYLIYGKRRAIGCALNCPVSDMKGIFDDKWDIRRAILSAHILEDTPLSDVLMRYSPVYFADKLPKIPYFLIYGDKDPYFFETQMPPFIERLESLNVDFKLIKQAGMLHCDIKSHPEALSEYCSFIKSLA